MKSQSLWDKNITNNMFCKRCGKLLDLIGGECSVCDADKIEARKTAIELEKSRIEGERLKDIQMKRENWSVNYEEEITHEDVLFSPVWITGIIRPKLIFDLVQSDLTNSEIRRVLSGYPEYDSENTRNYTIFRGSLWKMGLIKRHDVLWENEANDSYHEITVQLSDEGEKIQSIDEMISYLYGFLSRHYVGLVEFVSKNKEKGVTWIGREYSKLHGLKLSIVHPENRDVEIWAGFLIEYHLI